jgi:hypothetical protein
MRFLSRAHENSVELSVMTVGMCEMGYAEVGYEAGARHGRQLIAA